MEYQESKYRNSRMDYDEVYFQPDTIKDCKCLLSHDQYKKTLILSWRNLVSREFVFVYGFVIMPNHVPVIWEMKDPNSKEMPHASFNRFTSHILL